jgi:hypothetical protein
MKLAQNGRVFARRLLSGTALVGVAASAMIASPAFADSECGATTSGTVTCPASGNPYPNGITYTSPAVNPADDPGLDPAAPVYDLTVNLGDGVAIQSGTNPGVAIFGFNDGAATLNTFGNTTIAAAGTGALGVIGNTNYGDLTINTDSITVSGRASGGINANSNQGDVTINAGTTTISGDGSVGISANSFAGNVAITADTVNVDGYYAGGIVGYSAYGNVTIDAGTVTTTADGSFYNVPSTAIAATTIYGSLDVTANTVSTTADYSDGIRAIAYQGDGVTVDAGTISTAGLSSNGAFVQAAGNATLNVGSIATSGDTSYGAVVLTTAGGDATVSSTGAITTTGVQSYGVAAVAINGGDANVTVNDISTSGDASPAVYTAGDNVSVTINGDVSTTGTASRGVDAIASDGDATVINNGSVSTAGDNSAGIVAVSNTADASIISAGTVSTAGDYSVGVAVGAAGNAGLTVNNVSTDGFLSHAVYAMGSSVDVTVNGDIRTNDFGSMAVRAIASDGGATVTNNGSIDTAVGGGVGILAYGSNGVTISGTGTIVTHGGGASGIVANGYAGPTTITATSVTTSGAYSRGVSAQGSGDVTLDLGTVTTNGQIGTAIEVATFQNGTGPLDANLNVTVDNVTVNGGYSQGINAFSSNNGVLNITAGTVTVNGANGVGILSQSYTADTNINVGTLVTTGTGDAYNGPAGIFATSNSGNIAITSSDTVSSAGLNGIGIYAATDSNVTVNVNDVTTLGDNAPAVVALGENVAVTSTGTIPTSGANSDGIHTETSNATGTGGNTTIDTDVVTTLGDRADGIDALALDGGTITITHGAITTAGYQSYGVVAQGLYDVSVSGNGAVKTTGDEASGVFAVSILGDVNVDEGTISTAGRYSPGVAAASYFGSVTVAADNITTTGYASNGVTAQARYGGDVDVTVGNVTTSGDYSTGVDAQAYYDASATVSGTVATSGYQALGVNVYAGGAANVTNTGIVRTSGDEADAIHVESVYGDVVVSGTGSVSTTGDFSTGIFARAGTGTIDITTGTVTTTGLSSGIDAYAGGGVSVMAGTVRTTGAGANAVNAGGFYSVDVTVGTVSTSGADANGIAAASFGGDLAINAGSVLVSGTGSTAIRAFGFGGGTNIAATGAVRSTQATAINMIAGGAGGGGQATGDPALDGIARLTVTAGGAVQGGTNAVTSNALSATQIVNDGSITGGTGYAVQATGGAATITNNGALAGRLLLTDNADRLINAGIFTATGISDFGAGSDILTNSRTVRLGASASPQVVALNGLESFANTGLVDLRTGTAGDTLTIGGYSGTGAATLGLDVAFGATTTTVDRLNVTAAMGSTSVVLAPLNGQAILIPATTIVQATSPSSPTAFSISGGSQYNGLIQFGVVYNPTSFAYQLVSAPNATVYRQAKLAEGLASAWNRSADAISAHLTAGRDAGWGSPTTDSSGRVWLQMFGEVNKRDQALNVAFNGLTQNDVDLGYRQDAFGGQIGFDLLGTESETGGVTVGVSGGYQSSGMNFRGNDRFDIDAVNGTVYAAFQAGGLFLNGLAKYDYAWINSRGNAPVVNFNLDTKAKTWGGKVEAGFRFGSDTFFVEPAASLAYTSTDINRYGVLGGSFRFDDFTGLRGKAGARIGGSTPLGASSTLIFYAGGAAVHEFKGKDRLDFTSGGQTIALYNDRLGTYGQGTVGLNIVTAGGVTGFIEGHGEYGDDYKGGGGRAGIRIKF